MHRPRLALIALLIIYCCSWVLRTHASLSPQLVALSGAQALPLSTSPLPPLPPQSVPIPDVQFEDDQDPDPEPDDLDVTPSPLISDELDPEFTLDRDEDMTALPEESARPRPIYSSRPLQRPPPPAVTSPPALPTVPREPRLTCFSASAEVSVGGGRRVRMSELEIGHRVSVSTGGEVSPVVLFSHRDRTVTAVFSALHTSSGGTLTVTETHFVYIQREGKRIQVAARDVHIGDGLQREDGRWDAVVRIEDDVILTGLYNPHTAHGDIVVDGFIVSTYTSAVVSWAMGHALLAPVRAVARLRGLPPATWNFDRGLPVGVPSTLYHVIHLIRLHSVSTF